MNSYSIFPGTSPSRIYLAVVRADHFAGTQDSSPYHFLTRWKYTKTATEAEIRQVIDFERTKEANKITKAVLDIQGLLMHIAKNYEENSEDDDSTSAQSGSKSTKGKKTATKKEKKQKSLFDVMVGYLNKDIDTESVHSKSSAVSKSSAFAENEEVPLTEARARYKKSSSSVDLEMLEPIQEDCSSSFKVETEDYVQLIKCSLEVDGAPVGKKFFFYISLSVSCPPLEPDQCFKNLKKLFDVSFCCCC